MVEKGNKQKERRENQKVSKLTLKEKRRKKKDRKSSDSLTLKINKPASA